MPASAALQTGPERKEGALPCGGSPVEGSIRRGAGGGRRWGMVLFGGADWGSWGGCHCHTTRDGADGRDAWRMSPQCRGLIECIYSTRIRAALYYTQGPLLICLAVLMGCLMDSWTVGQLVSSLLVCRWLDGWSIVTFPRLRPALLGAILLRVVHKKTDDCGATTAALHGMPPAPGTLAMPNGSALHCSIHRAVGAGVCCGA